MSGAWSETQIAGHPCDLYEPARVNEHGYVVLYLHGVHLGRLVGQPAYEEQFERYGLRVAAPMTQRSWWTDRICPEFDERLTAERHVLDNVVPFLATHWNARPPQIALFGTSMGGQGALRLAFKHPRVFPIAAAISPAIDYHLRFYQDDEETLPTMYPDPETARQDTAILHVHPLNWPRHTWFCCDPHDERWYDSAQRLQMKLSALGIPHECELEASAGGHGWSYYSHMASQAVGFLVERLEQERLRVV